MDNVMSHRPARGSLRDARFAPWVSRLATLFLLSTLSACGNGRWGAELTLTLATTDASDLVMGPGDAVTLPSGHRVVLHRACLGVDTVVIAPVAPEGGNSEPGDTCFCHGDPPHCHGDCGPTQAGAAQPLIRSLRAGQDLLHGPAEVLISGVAPGGYDVITLSLGPPVQSALPAGCPDLVGSAFVLEGELTEPGATEGRALKIDLRVTDRITEALRAEIPAEATAKGGEMVLKLRLDAVLGAVDWSRVVPDPEDRVTIGGPTSANILATGELVAGLTSASSWSVTPGPIHFAE